MRRDDDPFTPPVYVKTRSEAGWPSDPFFYLVSRSGLFIGRNTEFFQSCVPAREFPPALHEQEMFFSSRYPLVPQSMIEYIVGFFTEVGLQGAEAIVLLAWDRRRRRMRAV